MPLISTSNTQSETEKTLICELANIRSWWLNLIQFEKQLCNNSYIVLQYLRNLTQQYVQENNNINKQQLIFPYNSIKEIIEFYNFTKTNYNNNISLLINGIILALSFEITFSKFQQAQQ